MPRNPPQRAPLHTSNLEEREPEPAAAGLKSAHRPAIGVPAGISKRRDLYVFRESARAFFPCVRRYCLLLPAAPTQSPERPAVV